jgi:hypothetical protein
MAYKNPLDERARAARRKHYENNKGQYLERNKKRKAEMRDDLNKVIDVPCMDCGVKYPPYVMDLDHRNPQDKVDVIARLITNGSWEKFLAEIDKCDIVCSNCHRERTHNKNIA